MLTAKEARELVGKGPKTDLENVLYKIESAARYGQTQVLVYCCKNEDIISELLRIGYSVHKHAFGIVIDWKLLRRESYKSMNNTCEHLLFEKQIKRLEQLGFTVNKGQGMYHIISW